MVYSSIAKLYSQKNHETTQEVDSFLLEYFSTNSKIAEHIKRRQETATTKIKSFFVRMGFQISGNNDWEILVPLCSLVELLNIGNYLIERGIDSNNPGELGLGKEIRKLVLESKFLKNPEKEIFKLMIKDIDKYLVIDNKKLIWENKNIKKDFFKEYKEKCLLVGGQFYGRCLELGYLKSEKPNFKIKKHLTKIGQIFGTAYQMLHEVADLLPADLKRFPEDFKYYQNQYNSIRKHKLTLPIYFALIEWKPFNKKLFFDLVQKKDYFSITKIFLKQKIIKKCKTFIRKYVKAVEPEFQYLPKNQWSQILKFGVNSVNSNIFWKHYKKLYAEVA